jgi:hypothetical protein
VCVEHVLVDQRELADTHSHELLGDRRTEATCADDAT